MRRIVLATTEASILVIVVFMKAAVITCGSGIVFRKIGARVHFPYHYTSFPCERRRSYITIEVNDCTCRLNSLCCIVHGGSFPVVLVYNSEPVIKFSE